MQGYISVIFESSLAYMKQAFDFLQGLLHFQNPLERVCQTNSLESNLGQPEQGTKDPMLQNQLFSEEGALQQISLLLIVALTTFYDKL